MTTIDHKQAIEHCFQALGHPQGTRSSIAFVRGAEWAAEQLAAPATAPEQDVHPDDKAVDRFAGRMKWKLANARAKGKSGWQDRSWTPDQISAALRQHVDKGDPTDVANYCMFLAARGEPITSATAPEQEVSVKQVDANNYCLILRLFGMEEEGDPVAEIERLRKDAERYWWLAKYLVSDDESHDDAIVAATTVAELDYVIDAAMKGTP